MVLPSGWLIEQKATQKDSLRVKHEYLRKLSSQAGQQRQWPAFRILFAHGDGEPRESGEWIAMPKWRFDELIEMMEAR